MAASCEVQIETQQTAAAQCGQRAPLFGEIKHCVALLCGRAALCEPWTPQLTIWREV